MELKLSTLTKNERAHKTEMKSQDKQRQMREGRDQGVRKSQLLCVFGSGDKMPTLQCAVYNRDEELGARQCPIAGLGR